MNNQYVIVGGGPCGLVCALSLSEIGKSVLLIDKNNSIGGCHRVLRVGDEEYFTEHGPRMYSSSYVNFKNVLKLLGTRFEDIYVKSHFNVQSKSTKNFSIKEKFILFLQLVKMTFYYNKNLKYTSVKDFVKINNFSEDTRDYMDRLCRLTDGVGADKYSMFEFMNLLNQNFFYSLYQPKNPNDECLFKLWENKLIKNKVKIMKGVECISFNENQITLSSNEKINYEKLILCIPPKPFLKLNNKSLYPNMNIDQWVKDNSYNNVISVSFHWKDEIQLPKIWGFPKDDWGIAFIVLTDYMKVEKTSKLVISTCITIQDKKSSITNKTAMESDDNELIDEVFRQLKISFPNLPKYSEAIINPTTDQDTAYATTHKQEFIDFRSSNPNIFYVGTQNGNSAYSFTSMESAVSNALHALIHIEPCLKNKITVEHPFELVMFVRYILIIIIIIIGLKYNY